ncbi:MAG: hypothetical protein K8S16_16145 [Bacteroidales bacterium]|nr:hypothetical protein [Bacteroidales bacterium]
MLIFVDKRIPKEAQNHLKEYGDVVAFETERIVYDAISGHPDIFMCHVNNKIIVAPNLPAKYKEILNKNKIAFLEGEEPLGKNYPETAKYNIVSTEKFLMHNFHYTDSKITDNEGDLDLIHLNQGYSRCNLLPLRNDHFITSDEGIYRILQNSKLKALFVKPDDILLPGFKHGFFGGTFGVYKDKVFIIGSLDKFSEGSRVREFIEKLNYNIIELYDGPLFDGGSLFFV